MATGFEREPMLEMFIFETTQLIEQLEAIMLRGEKSYNLSTSDINETFRIMHTIKGSSAMMMFNDISKLAHSIEDLFFYIREKQPDEVEYSKLVDIVLESIDFIKAETFKVEDGSNADGDVTELESKIRKFLEELKKEHLPAFQHLEENVMEEDELEQKQYIASNKISSNLELFSYNAEVFFEIDCEMESIRAFTLVNELQGIAEDVTYYPEEIMINDSKDELIRSEGLKIQFKSSLTFNTIKEQIGKTPFIRELKLKLEESLNKPENFLESINRQELFKENKVKDNKQSIVQASKQNIINVNMNKIDKLMDLMGELVIAESMVTQSPDIIGLQLDNFVKAARQLGKITDELQDVVMSIRMVPISATFQKMNRIVRDMSKKLGKEVELQLIGEETEVDKNIVENISDPLMHLIRNSIDHGIEETAERISIGKHPIGKVTLEAKNSGGDVWVFIRDNGRGIDRAKVLRKAKENGLLNKPEEELTDREINSFIFLPGFSTKEKISEFSGRGVGMDVVMKNIEKVGGKIFVDSIQGKGTTISIKIPLTLAIIDGMNIRVGNSRYTIPINLIRESFRLSKEDLIIDPHEQEMTLVRGQMHSIIRLHEMFKVKTEITNIEDGIIIMVEEDGKSVCLLADELLGQQPVVVKTLPSYIKQARGIAGCTLLGDGGISLILDIPAIIEY